jgi:iron complex transport system permease protein
VTTDSFRHPAPARPAGSTEVPADSARIAGLQRRARSRVLIHITGCAVVLLILIGVRIMAGRYPVAPDTLLRVLAGELVPGAGFIVLEEKLPRAVLAVLVGVALGMSGAMYRRTLRNPLATPDILGVSGMASAAVVVALSVAGIRGTGSVLAALCGGIAATVIVLTFAAGRGAGGLSITRVIVVGVGMTALGQAIVAGTLLELAQHDLTAAAQWVAGSLAMATWERISFMALALLVLVVPAAVLHARQAYGELGDDLTFGLGLRPRRERVLALLVGTCLAAVAAAVSGPLAFVALLAPPLARGLTRGRPSLALAAACGAVLVVAADLIAAEGFGAVDLPTGVVTGACGAPLMIVFLWMQRRGVARG